MKSFVQEALARLINNVRISNVRFYQSFISTWPPMHIVMHCENSRVHLSYFSIVPLTEGERILLVKAVSLTVYDIASTQSKSKSLGSVSFAESFLDSTIQVIQPGMSIHVSLYLHVPRLGRMVNGATIILYRASSLHSSIL